MSVTLSPSSQLAFQRPLTQLVKRTLAVSNHNSQPIVYKVKTTAPKQYCVRPNSGRIEPGETVEVQGEFWLQLESQQRDHYPRLLASRLDTRRGL
ncbi:PapD-like protein [Leucosporidium creatinivorum]|uniref:PapD-like protein n=1 Tax=Leucosporidium creatinivorum TaxID=106004 RepID=A0A1Y2CHB7_9BASI|nr:PapD-like protein [Leucosporidium creatinivorum]